MGSMLGGMPAMPAMLADHSVALAAFGEADAGQGAANGATKKSRAKGGKSGGAKAADGGGKGTKGAKGGGAAAGAATGAVAIDAVEGGAGGGAGAKPKATKKGGGGSGAAKRKRDTAANAEASAARIASLATQLAACTEDTPERRELITRFMTELQGADSSKGKKRAKGGAGKGNGHGGKDGGAKQATLTPSSAAFDAPLVDPQLKGAWQALLGDGCPSAHRDSTFDFSSFMMTDGALGSSRERTPPGHGHDAGGGVAGGSPAALELLKASLASAHGSEQLHKLVLGSPPSLQGSPVAIAFAAAMGDLAPTATPGATVGPLPPLPQPRPTALRSSERPSAPGLTITAPDGGSRAREPDTATAAREILAKFELDESVGAANAGGDGRASPGCGAPTDSSCRAAAAQPSHGVTPTLAGDSLAARREPRAKRRPRACGGGALSATPGSSRTAGGGGGGGGGHSKDISPDGDGAQDWFTTYAAAGNGHRSAASGGQKQGGAGGSGECFNGLSPALTPSNLGDFLVDAF
mmetsp:Transcript_9705/g.25117  ORF Transcript_9705/g.25117 Transcript_9705/m.25117 type:complete len:524 (-) Transcript_9705:303-1874(-)